MADERITQVNSDCKGLDSKYVLGDGEHKRSLFNLVETNKGRMAALADFLVHLEEGDSSPLEDTVTFMWRLAEDCHRDMATLQDALS